MSTHETVISNLREELSKLSNDELIQKLLEQKQKKLNNRINYSDLSEERRAQYREYQADYKRLQAVRKAIKSKNINNWPS